MVDAHFPCPNVKPASTLICQRYARAECKLRMQTLGNSGGQGIRGSQAADDALAGLGEEIRFRVRETPEWKGHAGELESEMLKRGMFFDVVEWSEDQAALPFGG
jgi:hypothetical protein